MCVTVYCANFEPPTHAAAMPTPPFRAAPIPSAATWAVDAEVPLVPEPDATADAESAAGPRRRLGDMDSHLHCSIIGTCLSTTELRKLVHRFSDVDGLSDLEVHHEAVRLSSQSSQAARALGKALDRRHEASVQRFARAKDAAALAELWQQSLKSGEVPGAYWAVLTHRHATGALLQQVFGDVHMLSHLVGAANRADIRRFVALEQENRELHERAERQQARLGELGVECGRSHAEGERLRSRVAELERRLQGDGGAMRPAGDAAAATAALSSAVALQTSRREVAEARAATLQCDVARLQQELEHLRAQALELGGELAAAEAELRSAVESSDTATSALHDGLAGRRLLYVGGRPSSGAAIRQLVLRHGGEYQRHDGGFEDRKGLLAAAVAWATLVVFPVDCVDHDSALALKRSCLRLGTPFLPLRSAGIGSFAAAVAAMARAASRPGPSCDGGPCLRHG